MSQQDKARYYQALKAEGVPFSKPYREYTTAELQEAYARLKEGTGEPPHLPPSEPDAAPPGGSLPPGSGGSEPELDPGFDAEALNRAYDNLVGKPHLPNPGPDVHAPGPVQGALPQQPRAQDPNEMAGQRQNSNVGLTQVIRVDDMGREWFQEEIKKPAFPKPRGRRVLTYIDQGVEEQTIKVGDYTETFEVAGTGQARTAEVKITLPSYQVGVYKDPRFPFRVHVYNGVEGFDLFEVQNYYGGAELVPPGIKRMYVENVLCYDIRTTVRAIMDEYRHQQLTGAHQ